MILLYGGICLGQDIRVSSVSISPEPYGAVITGHIGLSDKIGKVAISLDGDATDILPESDGSFKVQVAKEGHDGYVDMRITGTKTEGGTTSILIPAWVSEQGLEAPELEFESMFSEVVSCWATRDYRSAREKLDRIVAEKGNSPLVRKYIPLWEKALAEKPVLPEPAPSATADDIKALNLADCKYVDAKVGWGVPCWDVMLPSNLGPLAYFKEGGLVERFVLIHSIGWLKYDLGGKWERFTAQVGIPCRKGGSVRFEIRGDGKVLHTTKVLSRGESEKLDLDVKGVGQLDIQVTDAGDGNYGDWAVIGNPLVTR